jgi:hypothetical protein
MFLGKLKYASPEQAGFIKENEHLDHRSDLYSFGVVFYEMLAGRAPFLATNPHGYILKHATEKPLPISQTNPAVTIPPKLEEIVFKSLEKDRDSRFLSAEEFIRALEAIRNDVAPDAKYGVGERMMTLTARTTHVDLARTRTGATGAAPTATRPAGVPRPTGAQQDGATVIEKTRGSGPATMGDGATVIERTAGGESQATVVERVGGAGSQATVLEPKVPAWQQPRGSAEATVLERQVLAPPAAPKSKGLLFGGIAAAVVLAAAIGGYFALRPEPAPVEIPPTTTTPIATSTTTAGTTAGEEVTATATLASTTGSGALSLITASPNVSIESILNVDTNQPVTLSSDDRSLPFFQPLEPGNYKVTVADAGGSRQTLKIHVSPGEITPQKVKFGSPSVDDAMKELFGQ